MNQVFSAVSLAVVLSFYVGLSDAAATPSLAFDNPSPSQTDNFGSGIATDGRYVAIGAAGNGISGSGQVVVYDLASNDPTIPFAIINSPNSAGSPGAFGHSIAIDNGQILIGDPNESTAGNSAGAAHLYQLSDPAAPIQSFFRTASINSAIGDNNSINDGFGLAVDLNGGRALVGDRIAESGSISSSGAAVLFDAATGNVLETFVNPDPGAFDSFGGSLALEGDQVLIGAPLADAGTATVSSGSSNSVGKAFRYTLNADSTQATLTDTLTSPTAPSANAQFGFSLDLDEGRALVGEMGKDRAYLFGPDGTILQTFEPPAGVFAGDFGSQVALSGDIAIINNPLASYEVDGTRVDFAGEVYVFDVNTGQILQTLRPEGSAFFNDTFSLGSGSNPAVTVALADGVAVIGSPRADVPLFGGTNPTTSVGEAFVFAVDQPALQAGVSSGFGIVVPTPASALLLLPAFIVFARRR